ncbi:prepilin peptidase [Achromobacter sp. Marseille-Q0513]|uniref:prepilin peptidase n=1 Tax=Achromobacter sp. Marseille-Q0513 TaxID=2829161 RepID=UPI001B9E3C00|nr:A24 family peptidase [Achromobacter sp. Marseille-Q0513]MBR8654615.1 prepilin peptidase [Achromobacter sp. Marseille-Q0513]
MWQAFDLPQSLFLVLAALAGLAVGGWLTLLTHRLPRMMEREWQAHCQESAEPAVATEQACAPAYGLRAPASHCPQCAAPVRGGRRWPRAGWLLLKGRCAACGAAIGWRYPAIELLTAVLFAACAWRFGPTPIALCGMGLSAALVALAWIDLESTLLPDAITLPLAWAGLLVNLGDGFTPLPLAVLGAVAGYGFLWLIFHAFRYFTGREGMGYGDFKLLAALGAWFGVGALPMLLLAASLAGVLVGGTMTLAGRASRGQPLPFGPYLALAGVAVLLLGGEPGLARLLP